MKRLGLALTLVLLLGVSTCSWAEGQFGIGWQSSSFGKGISAKVAINPNLCLQGIVGYASLTMDNPMIKVGSEKTALDMGISASGMTLGGRGLFKVKSEKNMDVYVGGGMNYLMLSGEIVGAGDKYEGSGGAMEFNGVGGVEYRFQGLPNLAFSTEIGFSYAKLNEIDLKYRSNREADKSTLIPNTSIKNLFLGVGIHYYF
ncbi:MAG: hypothetical protein ABH870_05080 [bacterium]